MKYIILAIVSMLFLGCSKKNLVGIQVDSCNNIAELFIYLPYSGSSPSYQLALTVSYDGQGRVKTVIGQGGSRSDYVYFDDRIELTNQNGAGNFTTIYYLDNMKRITRTNHHDYKFTYNTEGYLISCRQPYGTNGQIAGYIQYFLNWENGNLIDVYTNEPNVADRKYTFHYYNENNQDLLGYNSPLYISNLVGDWNSFILIKNNFYGKQPKNLYKTLTQNDTQTFPGITYQYDSKGRINLTPYHKFTYQCP